MWFSIFIALINIPLGFYQILFRPPWGVETDWRGVRIFGNLFWHNSYSLYLLPSILTLYAFLRTRFKLRNFNFISTLLLLDIFTFSRAGLISLLAGIFIFEFLYKTGIKINTKKIIMIFL